jgi:hypothetical protein
VFRAVIVGRYAGGGAAHHAQHRDAVRARSATSALCLLIETASDSHTANLVAQLPAPDPSTGHTIAAQLRKEPPS